MHEAFDTKLAELDALSERAETHEQFMDLARSLALFVNIVREVENSKINQWGEHAHLAGWFLQVKDSLPRERFVYDQGEGWQVIWATPAASYQNLEAEIGKGPGGQWDAEVRSILEQLHNLFANKGYANNE